MRVLVVGGAGYIGSHVTKLLLDEGHDAVALDNLSTGHRDAVPARALVKADLSQRILLDKILSTRNFDGVMHFAGSQDVGESIAHPEKYYWNNVANTLHLLDAMVRRRLARIVFSSSAAIFGEPRYLPVDETHQKAPVDPYGRCAWMVEQILADYERAHGMRYVCLRYFNAAGADPSGTQGERHHPETHLVPRVLQAAAGRVPAIEIFGTDYPTPDGSCIRDYVHVSDLCRAHVLAMAHLLEGGRSRSYNLGNGRGHSVKEVIDAAARVTGAEIPVRERERREDDPARLVVDSTMARRELGWQPRYSELDTIMAHAWAWERSRPAPGSGWRGGRDLEMADC
jgi:UDP-glucose 4-epimerase